MIDSLPADVCIDVDRVDAMAQRVASTRWCTATAFGVTFLDHTLDVGEVTGSILGTRS